MRHHESESWDVLVYGGTPGGIMSAIAAARLGRRVALMERQQHLGGMTTSGLGKSDIENRAAIGGLFREFVGRVYREYVSMYGPESEEVRLSRNGYYYEPSVAERVLEQMLADEAQVTVLRRRKLLAAETIGNRLTSIDVVEGATDGFERHRAAVFIDATYEGDLSAAAGAEFRIGRESRWEFDEPHAGVIYLHYETGELLPGSTGEADDRLPAYTYRLCLTTDPENSHKLVEPPPNYDRTLYIGYLRDLEADRLVGPKKFRDGWGYEPAHYDTLVRALSVTKLPNQKTDVNINPRPLGFPFAEENRGYVEGDEAKRESICRRHREMTLGLLYFLQNDDEVPAAHREIARQYHLPRDEFRDNGHFPWQIYVREARRIIGEYTLTENDVTRAPGRRRATIHFDSIAAGEFPIDSFPTRKAEPGRDDVLEGYLSMLEDITIPYQIPYRIMVPCRVDGLLTPVAASTTHVAFSTIRMEPCWMAMGQAAGVAAALSVGYGVAPRNVPIESLQQQLIEQGQVLTYFSDIESSGALLPALQYFGSKGLFDDYAARLDDAVDWSTGAAWLRRMLACAEIPTPPTKIPDADQSFESDLAVLAALGLPVADAIAAPPNDLPQRSSLCNWLVHLANVLEIPHPISQLLGSNGRALMSRGEYCLVLYQMLRSIPRAPLKPEPATSVLQGPHIPPVQSPTTFRN